MDQQDRIVSEHARDRAFGQNMPLVFMSIWIMCNVLSIRPRGLEDPCLRRQIMAFPKKNSHWEEESSNPVLKMLKTGEM